MIVNGHHHKGIVYIRLSWDDTYSYFLINDNGTIKKSVDNIANINVFMAQSSLKVDVYEIPQNFNSIVN